jgi:CRP-like cAMP-binding protein
MAESDDQAIEQALQALLLKLRARDVVDEAEEEVLRDSIARTAELGPGRALVRPHVTLSESILLFEGLVCRYRDLASGERQIMELHVAGDFVDLHGFLLKQLDHTVGTLTPVRYAAVPHEALRRITETQPHLARLLWLSTLIDAAIHREQIVSVGRRTALSRIAHLLCELNVRLKTVGLADDEGYALPLTQAEVADATGLTSVHVNRMLRKLRNEDLLTFRNGRVTIHDWEGLQRVAEFDPTYLHLERRPR